ncbi:L-isoaspartate family protein [Vibrio cholerae]|nr:L-isoaspartate family protein [Vibrio cholerae]GHX61981.1 protein-L-isoaspartate O-methyltransferase [Vibrio cholerae]
MANPKADRLIQFLTEQGITSPQVLAAIHALPREFFVAPAMMHQAYDNTVASSGCGAKETRSVRRSISS